MISKKDFVKTIDTLKRHDERIRKINAALDITLDFDMLDDLVVGLLEQLMNVSSNEPYGSVIYWWIWDLDFGRKWKPDALTIDGVPVDLSTADKLYDYLTSH